MKGRSLTGSDPLRGAVALLAALALLAAAASATRIAFASRPDTPAAASKESEIAPLTNEDVVRMVASGMTAEKILKSIAASPARFDVEPDIVEELRVAGVPEEIIRAMIAKARAEEARAPKAAPAPSNTAAEKSGWIEVVFDDDPNGTPASNSVMLPSMLPDPNNPSDRRKVEFAFFFICTQPLHVPDMWMTASPMDQGTGRHQVLFFQQGTLPATGKKEKDYVYLAHPDRWRFAAEAGEHEGLAGAALRTGSAEKFVVSVASPFKTLKVEAGAVTRIEIRLRTRFGHVAPRGQEEARSRLEELDFTNIGNTGRSGTRTISTMEIVKVSPPARDAPAGGPPAAEPSPPPPPPS
jgi:hypothetical protein